MSSSTGPSNCTTAWPARAQHEPRPARRAAPALAVAVDAPRAGHAQVRVDDALALEAQEQVLAVGVDGLDRAAGQLLRPAVGREARVGRRELVGDAALEHRADPVRGVMDGVALGHRCCPRVRRLRLSRLQRRASGCRVAVVQALRPQYPARARGRRTRRRRAGRCCRSTCQSAVAAQRLHNRRERLILGEPAHAGRHRVGGHETTAQKWQQRERHRQIAGALDASGRHAQRDRLARCAALTAASREEGGGGRRACRSAGVGGARRGRRGVPAHFARRSQHLPRPARGGWSV